MQRKTGKHYMKVRQSTIADTATAAAACLPSRLPQPLRKRLSSVAEEEMETEAAPRREDGNVAMRSSERKPLLNRVR